MAVLSNLSLPLLIALHIIYTNVCYNLLSFIINCDNAHLSAQGKELPEGLSRPLESALKGWMKQHVQTVEASLTMAEVQNILLDQDVGCIPVVMDNTKQLIGMVTRTDLLRQHRYYNSLHYHNKGFSDSIAGKCFYFDTNLDYLFALTHFFVFILYECLLAARKPIIELRKKLKKFDVEF